MEIWKDIVGFEEYYEVSNMGRVRSKERLYRNKSGRLITKHSKILKPFGDTYLRVGLKKPNDDKVYKKLLHRVVLEAFVENPENKPTANHKDGNKQNCELSNLEWATYEEQIEHAIKTGLRDVDAIADSVRKANSIPVNCTKIETSEVISFSSLTEASNYFGVTTGCILDRIKNHRIIKGWLFEYTV